MKRWALIATLLLPATAVAQDLPDQWSETDRAYYEAWGLSLDDPDVYYRYGAQLAAGGWGDSARIAFEKALALEPDHALTHYALGELLWSEGEVEEAVPHFEVVVAAGAGAGSFEALAHTRLGRIAASQGRRDEAFAHFSRAVELNPDVAENRYNLASSLRNRGRRPEAIAQLEKALEIDPDFAMGRRKLAALLAEDGRYADAVPHYQVLIDANDRDPVALYDMAVALDALGQPERARESFERSLAVARSHPRYRKMAQDLEAQLNGKASEANAQREPAPPR